MSLIDHLPSLPSLSPHLSTHIPQHHPLSNSHVFPPFIVFDNPPLLHSPSPTSHANTSSVLARTSSSHSPTSLCTQTHNLLAPTLTLSPHTHKHTISTHLLRLLHPKPFTSHIPLTSTYMPISSDHYHRSSLFARQHTISTHLFHLLPANRSLVKPCYQPPLPPSLSRTNNHLASRLLAHSNTLTHFLAPATRILHLATTLSHS